MGASRLFKLLVLIAIGFGWTAQAWAESEFEPDHWSKGLHLLAGVGPTSLLFVSAIEQKDLGVGVHLKADLDYVINESWAIDWSSGTDFNKVDAYLSWNTQFTIGIKYRIADDPIFNTKSSYIKLFAGRSPSVIFFYGQPPQDLKDLNVDRIQFDGTVVGFTTGMLHKMPGGSVWFHEFTWSAQTFDRFDAIKMQGEVPIVVRHDAIPNVGTVYGLFFTVGGMIF